jgi:hypothetical protein
MKRTQGLSGGGQPSSRPQRSPSPKANVPSTYCPTGPWWWNTTPPRQGQLTPHTRDELYVVAQGSGTFVNGDDQHTFSAGDVFIVRSGVCAPHRFGAFTDDFGTWVMFYGPEGGERPR